MFAQKKRHPRRGARVGLKRLLIRLDDVHIQACNCTVEVGTNHLLTVASHNTLTWGEVLWSEDCRCNDEGYIRSIYITGLKVATALITNKNLVAWEVRVLVDRETVAQCTNRCCTQREWLADLSISVKAVLRLVKNRSLEDGCDLR